MKKMKGKIESIREVLKPSRHGKAAQLRGWAYRVRKQKSMIFIILRDSTGLIQCVIKDDSKFWKEAEKITTESSLVVKGTVKKDERAPTGYELAIKDLEVVSIAETYPIARDISEEFLLDVRHLTLRMPKYQAIMRIRSKVFEAIHEFYKKSGYTEYQSPVFQSTQCEGGSTLFGLDYFGKQVYLTQTWQLYAEPAIFALEKIYCIAPTFRAEKSITSRHLTEFWMHEVETAWQDFEELQKQGEELISHICQKVAKECQPELKTLGVDYKEIAKIKAPFPRLTYTEAVKLLKKEGHEIEWGKDLRTIEEQKISAMFKKPVIVTRYPKAVKAFYMKEDPKDPKVVQGFDMLAGGLEIIGGSAREDDQKKIIRRLKEIGEDSEKYKFYLDTRKYGSVPHSGFGMGVERTIQWLCKLDSIRDAIPFPRTPTRCTP